MTDGMRRAPRLWEQKLEGMIKASGVTGFGGAASSAVVSGPTPGPDGPGSEPSPPPIVEPDPSTPRLPGTPSVFAAIGGLSILWTGLDADGFPFPTGTKVQVHVSASTGFTPDATTQKGLLNPGERIVVTDLTSGTTYYVKFVVVGPDGEIGEESAQASLTAGFVLSTNIGTGTIDADMVSFDATAIGGIQQFVGTTAPTITNGGTANQLPKDGSTWINTSNGSYYTLTSGAWVQRQWDTAAIAAGAINTLQIATGAITADSAIIANAAIKNAMIDNLAVTDAKIQSLTASKLTAGTIDANVITVTNLNASNITTGTITGRLFQTGTGSARVSMAEATATFGADAINFYSGGSRAASFYYVSGDGYNSITTDGRFTAATAIRTFGALYVGSTAIVDGAVTFNAGTDAQAAFSASFSGANRAFRVDGTGNVFSYGIDDNTSVNAANVRVGASAQLLKSTSTVRVKDDLVALAGDLVGVPVEKISDDPASIDPYDVLLLCPTEFRSLCRADADGRMLGFIAEDVAAKLPWAANWDDEGIPSAVEDRPILAALLFVVREQQEMISDLSARLEALEG